MAELTPVDWEVRGRPDATMCAYGQTLPQTGGCQQRVRRPPVVTRETGGSGKNWVCCTALGLGELPEAPAGPAHPLPCIVLPGEATVGRWEVTTRQR